MEGVLPYKWEAYCDTNGRSTDNVSLSSERRGTGSTAIQRGGVLQYNWRRMAILFGEVVVVVVSDILLNSARKELGQPQLL